MLMPAVFDIERYLNDYSVNFKSKAGKDGSTIYILDSCPFDSSHTKGESSIIKAGNGTLFFQCFHNSCKGKTWHDFRQLTSGSQKLGAYYSGGKMVPPLPGKKEPETQNNFSFIKLASVEFRLPDWLIKGFLEKDTLSMFFGDPGCGKTFVGVDISCSVATGKPFHERLVAQGPVLYIAGEGHNGLKRRFRAWEIRHQVSLDDAPIFVSNGPGCFCDAAGAKTVNAAIEASGVKPVAVIVDTVARNFGPGDENSTQDMTAFINGLDLIRTKYGCAVILIHHTGHADKSRGRGAMALKGALDAEYRLDKDDMGVVRMDCTKMKDFEPPHPTAFRINTVELGIFDEDGQEITSAVLDGTVYEPPTKKGSRGRGKNQTVALEILDILYEEHRDRLTNSNFDPATARVLITDWRDRCIDAGMTRQSWHACKKSLDEQSLIELAHGYVERINA